MRMYAVGVCATIAVLPALLPAPIAAQSCANCWTGGVDGEPAHKFTISIDDEFECGEIGTAECHFSYTVAGKCGENHSTCGGPDLMAALKESRDLENPVLFQSALSDHSEYAVVDASARSLQVIACDGSVIADLAAPTWVSDEMLASLEAVNTTQTPEPTPDAGP